MKKLLGKWQIARLFIIQKSGRQIVKTYADGDYTWEFLPDRTLTEHISGQHRTLEYYHDPGILLIQRPKSIEIYYIDFLSDDEFFLSDIPNRVMIEVVRK